MIWQVLNILQQLRAIYVAGRTYIMCRASSLHGCEKSSPRAKKWPSLQDEDTSALMNLGASESKARGTKRSTTQKGKPSTFERAGTIFAKEIQPGTSARVWKQ